MKRKNSSIPSPKKKRRIDTTLIDRESLMKLLKKNNGKLKDNDIQHLEEGDLEYLYEYYDRVAFDGQIRKLVKKKKFSVMFKTHLRSKKHAGVFKASKQSLELSISVSKPIFDGIFQENTNSVMVNGIHTRCTLESLLVVFEHELIHFYLFVETWGSDKPPENHGSRFQSIALEKFGHTDFRHSIGRGDSSEHLEKHEMSVGMNIQFISKTGENVKGVITKINIKTAGVDSVDGRSMRVPFSMIRKYEGKLEINKKELANRNSEDLAVGMNVKFSKYKGVILKINQKTARVQSVEGKEFRVPFRMMTKIKGKQVLSLEDVKSKKKELKDKFYVGMKVKYTSKDGTERRGEVLKLNPRRAKIRIDIRTVATVPYTMLKKSKRKRPRK